MNKKEATDKLLKTAMDALAFIQQLITQNSYSAVDPIRLEVRLVDAINEFNEANGGNGRDVTKDSPENRPVAAPADS